MKKIEDFLHLVNVGEQSYKDMHSEYHKSALNCMIFVIVGARLLVSSLPKARIVKKIKDFLQLVNVGEQRHKETCSENYKIR